MAQKSHGVKLREFLFQELMKRSPVSSKYIRRLIDKGAVWVNGKLECFGSRIVQQGDVISLQLPEEEGEASRTDLAILYEDDCFLAVLKPPFLVSALDEFVKRNVRILPHYRLVHRLDKETSGVLLIAKSDALFDYCKEQFQAHQVQKRYLALVYNAPKNEEGSIIKPLALKQRVGNQAIWHIHETGLYAETSYKVLRRGPHASLLEVWPKTGRTHQVRVHLASIGCPLVGDKIYGRVVKTEYSAERHLLHASRLMFRHPLTQKECAISAPLPEDFMKALHVFIGVSSGDLLCAFSL